MNAIFDYILIHFQLLHSFIKQAVIQQNYKHISYKWTSNGKHLRCVDPEFIMKNTKT